MNDRQIEAMVRQLIEEHLADETPSRLHSIGWTSALSRIKRCRNLACSTGPKKVMKTNDFGDARLGAHRGPFEIAA
jgi:hypothetical protein